MNWKALGIAVAAIIVVGLILFGSPILRNMLLVNAGLLGQERYVNTVTGLFVAISVSIVLVAALGQLVSITWNGWQLGGVFGGMVLMIMVVSLLNPHFQVPFVSNEDEDPPLLLTQFTFQCNDDVDEAFVYKIGGEKERESVESIAVAIYQLDRGAKRKIEQILAELKEMSGFEAVTLIEPKDKEFAILKSALRKHLGTVSHDSWIAYEVKLHDELSMRTVDTRLPIPLQAVGNYPTVFLMKMNPVARSGSTGVTDSTTATLSPATSGVRFERFAHMILDSTNPTPVGNWQFDGLLDMKMLIGVTERKC